MDEHGYFLQRRVGRKEERALVAEIFLDVLEAQALQAEGELHSQNERAPEGAEELQVVSPACRSLPAQRVVLSLISLCFALLIGAMGTAYI